jgi:hypothetical protein
MGNKISKHTLNSKNTHKKHQSKIETLLQSKIETRRQSKIEEYICQSCEESILQLEYSPYEWSINISDNLYTSPVCNNKFCKWYKTK